MEIHWLDIAITSHLGDDIRKALLFVEQQRICLKSAVDIFVAPDQAVLAK